MVTLIESNEQIYFGIGASLILAFVMAVILISTVCFLVWFVGQKPDPARLGTIQKPRGRPGYYLPPLPPGYPPKE